MKWILFFLCILTCCGYAQDAQENGKNTSILYENPQPENKGNSKFEEDKEIYSHGDVFGGEDAVCTVIEEGANAESAFHSADIGKSLGRNFHKAWNPRHTVVTITNNINGVNAGIALVTTTGKKPSLVMKILYPGSAMISYARSPNRLSIKANLFLERLGKGTNFAMKSLGVIASAGMLAYSIVTADNEIAIASVIVSTVISTVLSELASSALSSIAKNSYNLAAPVVGVALFAAQVVADMAISIVTSIVVDVVIRSIVDEVVD